MSRAQELMPIDRSQPPLGGLVLLTRGPKGWFVGQTSSDPE